MGKNRYIDNLLKESKKLLSDNEYEKGVLGLKEILEIDPEYIDSWNVWLWAALKNKKYDDVFYLFDNMPLTEDKYHRHDGNYYLYLLNFITELDEKYKERTKSLKLADIQVPTSDTRFNDRVWQNRIRSLVLQKKFSIAYEEQKEVVSSSCFMNVSDLIVRELLKQIVGIEKSLHNTVLALIEKKEYDRIIEILDEREDRCGLSAYDYYTLILAQTIKNITLESIIPRKRKTNAVTVFGAIKADDYELALKRCERDGRGFENNAIYVLLKDVCNRLKEKDVSSEKREIEKPRITGCDETSFRKLLSECKDFLDSEDGLVLLDPIDQDNRRKLHALVRETEDLYSFSIDKGPDKRVVIRKRPIIDMSFNIRSMIDLASKDFSRRRYTDSIRKYLLVYNHLGNPSTYIYSGLGYAYLKKGEFGKALDFFEITEAINKAQDLPYDYSAILQELRSMDQTSKEEQSEEVSEQDFDEDNNFGIANFSYINDYIILSGSSVLDACQKFGLNHEQTDTVRLIYARNFFRQGMTDKGEELLRDFEDSDYKTEKNLMLFKNIRKNRSLYAKNSSDDNKKLLLTIKP